MLQLALKEANPAKLSRWFLPFDFPLLTIFVRAFLK